MRDETDRMPRATMAWGIALLFGGGLLIVLAPTIVNLLIMPNTESWQAMYLLVDTVVSVLRVTIAPLGAALIAASLVMRYVDRRLGGGPAERPRRWYFPPSAD